MSDSTLTRLFQERKLWRKNHPLGFTAKPSKNADGTLNLMVWDCYIPGQRNTLWEGGLYFLRMYFRDCYPLIPPRCVFDPPLLHPNVFKNGAICLSILNQRGSCPDITIKQILLTIQELLDNPNLQDTVHSEAYTLYRNNRAEYNRRIKCQAKRMSARPIHG